MKILRRPIQGYGITNHRVVSVTPAGFQRGGTPDMRGMDWSQAGPSYKGMDPSDPLTWPREYSPQPGMIAQLNFDGAAGQSRTPTGGLQRGRQQKRRG